jgi:hypothetical protein
LSRKTRGIQKNRGSGQRPDGKTVVVWRRLVKFPVSESSGTARKPTTKNGYKVGDGSSDGDAASAGETVAVKEILERAH